MLCSKNTHLSTTDDLFKWLTFKKIGYTALQNKKCPDSQGPSFFVKQ